MYEFFADLEVGFLTFLEDVNYFVSVTLKLEMENLGKRISMLVELLVTIDERRYDRIENPTRPRYVKPAHTEFE